MVLEIPEDIKVNFIKDKSEATIKTYTIMINKLFKELFDTNQFSVDKLKNTDKVKDYIENKNREKRK